MIERTRAGLAAARARGRVGGRPKKLGKDQRRAVRKLCDKGELPITVVATMFKVSRQVIYSILNEDKQLKGEQ